MTGTGLWPSALARAACSNSWLNPDDWYPVSVPVAAARREAAAAITVCAACPVRGECLEWALRNWAIGQFGVWGGTVPAERQKLRAGRVTQLAHALPENQPVGQAIHLKEGSA
jgi:WhiB family transcriptional regulator, redox-sensing transcriptional regulator